MAEDAAKDDAKTESAPGTVSPGSTVSETGTAPAPEDAAAKASAKKEKKAPKAASKEGVRLHVKNLDETLTSEALSAIFASHGTVKKGEVKTDKDGKSKGFGQVIMSTQEEAAKAIAELNGTKQGEKEMSVVMAPEVDKTKDKGKGSSDKPKGKGKGKAQANAAQAYQQPFAGYPAWMYPNASPDMSMMGMGMGMGMMDPVQAQIMQQQMMTWQLYAHMATQPQVANEKGAGKKGKGKGKAKDKGTKVEGTFTGKLKSINFREDKGYGFIDCAETKATYDRDVYVGADLVPKGAKVGDQFEFNVMLDQRGQLRATNVSSKS